MVGETLDSVGDLMLNPVVEIIINNFESSLLDTDFKTKLGYIRGLRTAFKGKHPESSSNPNASNLIKEVSKLEFESGHPIGTAAAIEMCRDVVEELANKVENAEETRILGRFLKINQGLYTNRAEMQVYLSDIINYIEGRFCESDEVYTAIETIENICKDWKLDFEKLSGKKTLTGKDKDKYEDIQAE